MGFSDTINDAIDTASDLTFDSIFNIIFHTDTFPGPYAILCIYICFYLRLTTKSGGMSWYRSFILGLALAILPRYTLSWTISRLIPETKDYGFLVYFSVIWALFNLCPFDLVFKFCNRAASRFVLVLMQAHAESLITITNLFNVVSTFTNDDKIDNSKVLMYMYCIELVPLFVQGIDMAISGEKRFFIYPVAHFKRIVLIILVSNFITQETALWPESIIDCYSLIPVLSLINCVFRTIDFFAYEGYPFHYVDVIFPSLNDGSKRFF